MTVSGTGSPAAFQDSYERNLSWQARTVSRAGRNSRAATWSRCSDRKATSASFWACTRPTSSRATIALRTSR